MRPDKKAERDREKFKAFAAGLLKKENPSEVEISVGKDDPTRNLEGALYSLDHKFKGFVQRTCKHCGEIFGTNYLFAGYCGDDCRAKHLLNTTGLVYHPSEDRWGYHNENPVILSPEFIQKLREFLANVYDSSGEVKQEIEPTTGQPLQEDSEHHQEQCHQPQPVESKTGHEEENRLAPILESIADLLET